MPPDPEEAARRVTVVIPLFNEERTIEALLRRVLAQECVRDVIVIDDASTDRSASLAREAAATDHRVSLLRHGVNSGKGACIRTALPHAKGAIVLIQDADLEYDPADYARLAAPILEDRADAVIGSRLGFRKMGGRSRYFFQGIANHLSTLAVNLATSHRLADVHCGYKAFRTGLLRSLRIEESRFGADLELVIKTARRRARIAEVPVSYRARSYAEGKKIGWRDALRSVVVILKYGLPARFTAPRRNTAARSSGPARNPD